jgi:hypothetical protein
VCWYASNVSEARPGLQIPCITLNHVRRSVKLVCQSFLSASAVRGTSAALPALPGVDGVLGVLGVLGLPTSGARAKDL